jgi:hypothetical protein
VELVKLRSCLSTLPTDGSWVHLIGEQLVEPQSSAPIPTERERGFHPRWTYDTTFFGASTVNIRPEVIGPTPDGYRVNFYAKSGTLLGPGIDAVLLEGTDNVSVRPDGMAVLTVSGTWQNRDGALLFERARGMTDLGPLGYNRIASGSWSGTPPITLAHTWLCAQPKWAWLNRRQTWGLGRTLTDVLQVQTDIYFPTVGERIADA